MHTVYDWLSARGDRAARHGRKNRRQREWPAMSSDTVDRGQQLAHGDFGGFADRAQALIVSTHPRIDADGG